ncbi:MAG: hypothetical protein DWQ04_10490 [Chloroflexi bacterium]|nr:MAG: hypothetical protein DWQ04_10490 [Chloroflexota bacterium]
MKRLHIDWSELIAAFADSSTWEINYYLDTETGQVLMVTDDARRQVEQIYEAHFDPDAPDSFDMTAALTAVSLSDWEKEDVLTADFVEINFGSRVIDIPETQSYEAYNEMQNFIDTIEDERMSNQLRTATEGRGAFGRFRDVLRQHLAAEQRWYAFQENQVQQRILEWLEEEEIEPINMPQPKEVNIEAMLELRHKLLAEVRLFVHAASRIPGITRIALIGSLTTDKPDPKDADLLVTVTNGMDLTPLATLGRKLQGHAQSFNRGGEVFLADPQHHYLGRTCPWKQCGPGTRASCDAYHCGKRPFLHDDLGDMRISEKLIVAPPIELWPKVVTRVVVPEDVVERVIRPLQQQDA